MVRTSGKIFSACGVCWWGSDDWQLLKILRGGEGKAALAFEQFFQTAVMRTRFATDNGWGDQIAALPACAAALEPVCVADGSFNGNAGDF